MAQLYSALFLAVFTACFVRTNAVISSYNLTQSFEFPFKAIDNPPKGCTEPGSCELVNVTVQAHAIYSLCGFNAHNKLTYYWNARRQLQTFFVRERTLKKCDIFNFDSCKFISSSRCRRTNICTRGLKGLSYGGSMCFVMVNNRNQSSWFQFKVTSRPDKSLAWGNAYCMILTLIFIGLILEPLVKPFVLPKVKGFLAARKAASQH